MDGVSATDANGNDITNLIQVEGKVDTQTPGSYTLTYSVTDENGNSTSVERHIVVVKSSSESGDNQSNGNSSSTNSQTHLPLRILQNQFIQGITSCSSQQC